MRTLVLASGSLLLLSLGVGCASRPDAKLASEQRDAPMTKVAAAPVHAANPGHAEDEEAQGRAAREAEEDAAFSAFSELRPVQIPAGIPPHRLVLRSTPAAHSQATLAELLGMVADRASKPDEEPAPDEAVRAYIRGRDAALRGRHMEAVVALQEALKLDPRSSAVLRQLARSYRALGNVDAARAQYEALVGADPDDSEALLTLAIDAIDQGQSEQAFKRLVRLAHLDDFDHDPAAKALTYNYLALLLDQRALDGQVIESGRIALRELPRVTVSPLYARQAEAARREQPMLWLTVGDAHARLQQPAGAASAWEQAERTAQELSIFTAVVRRSLLERRMYLALARNDSQTAADAYVASVRSAIDASVDDSSDAANIFTAPPRDFFLEQGRYLAPHAAAAQSAQRRLLNEAGRAREKRAWLIAAASLAPSDALTTQLAEHLRLHPLDQVALRALIAQASLHVPERAARELSSLANHHDALAQRAATLLAPRPHAEQVLSALEPMQNSRDAVLLRGHLLAQLGSLAQAWSVVESAQRTWPGDAATQMFRLRVASLLEDPQLLRRALDATAESLDPAVLVARASALRQTNQPNEAEAALESLREAQDPIVRAAVALERARIAVRRGELVTDPRERRPVALHAGEVIDDADAAWQAVHRMDVMRDPSLSATVTAMLPMISDGDPEEEIQALRLSIFGPGGQAPDAQRMQEIVRSLQRSRPDSLLFERLALQELLARQQTEAALERALLLHERSPAEGEVVLRALTAWQQLRNLEEAEQWLRDRLGDEPGNPVPLEILTRLLMTMNRRDDARALLEQAAEAHPQRGAIAALLETLYAAQGENALALQLGEQRLLQRPVTLERELQRAVIAIRADDSRQALTRLQAVAPLMEQATPRQVEIALQAAARLQDDHPDRARALMQSLSEQSLRNMATPPLLSYAAPMNELAEAAQWDELEALARKAAQQSLQDYRITLEESQRWRQLAQQLVDAGSPRGAAVILNARLTEPENADFVLGRELLPALYAAEAAAGVPDASYTIEALQWMEEHRAGRDANASAEARTKAMIDAYFDAARVNTLVGNAAGGETLYRRLLELDPNHTLALNNLAYQLVDSNHGGAEVRGWIERAQRAEPDEPNVIDTLGWLRYKEGRFQRDDTNPVDAAPGALELIRRALELEDDPSAELHDHLGDVLWRVGQRETARAEWRKAVALTQSAQLRQQAITNLQITQARLWGLIVADSEDVYDQNYAAAARRAAEKIAAVERGGEPAVAPTFAEAGVTEDAADADAAMDSPDERTDAAESDAGAADGGNDDDDFGD